MNLRIKVRSQYNPKIIPANTLVECNRYLLVIKQIKDLREHDEFLLERHMVSDREHDADE